MNQEKISNLIKQLRKKENLTQAQFANKYNVTFQAVSKWENGKSLPDIVLLKQICKDYNISIDEVLEGEINKKIKSASGGRYELNEATLYTAFKRLEDGGCINSYWGAEGTGARRKYYHITPTGIDKCRSLIAEWETAKKIIDELIETEENKNE